MKRLSQCIITDMRSDTLVQLLNPIQPSSLLSINMNSRRRW
jgi:hypothetical protein